MDTEKAYHFVTNLAAGKRVQLFYLPSGLWPINYLQFTGPHAVLTIEEWTQLQQTAPNGIYESLFRIVRNWGSKLDLEWI